MKRRVKNSGGNKCEKVEKVVDRDETNQQQKQMHESECVHLVSYFFDSYTFYSFLQVVPQLTQFSWTEFMCEWLVGRSSPFRSMSVEITYWSDATPYIRSSYYVRYVTYPHTHTRLCVYLPSFQQQFDSRTSVAVQKKNVRPSSLLPIWLTELYVYQSGSMRYSFSRVFIFYYCCVSVEMFWLSTKKELYNSYCLYFLSQWVNKTVWI